MGAFEYTALDNGGSERRGILEGDTPRHIRQLLRERQLLPVTVSEVARRKPDAQRSFSSGARRLRRRSLALHAPAGDAGARRTAAGRVAARRVAADREAARAEHRAGRARTRHGRPHALRTVLPNFRASFPRSTARPSQPASSPASSTVSSSASPTTPRAASRSARKSWRPCSTPSCSRSCALPSSRACMVYVVPKVVAVFESGQGQVAADHPDSDRDERLHAQLRPVHADRCRAALAFLFNRWLRNPANRRALSPHAAAPAAGRQADARLQHRALHAHLQHPLGELGAGARGAAYLR